MNQIADKDIPKAIGELVTFFQYAKHRMAYFWREIAALQAKEILRETGQMMTLPVQFRAQNSEDVLIWNLLGRKTTGFFIEAGAFDGVTISATYALEAIGWTGLLVEPIEAIAEKCTRRRPNSRVVRAALSGPEYAGKTARLNVVESYWGGALSFLDGVRLYGDNNEREKAKIVPESVPLETLDRLLEGHDGPIDAVVLDVEGHEEEVLRGFDIARWRPTVLIVEDVSLGDHDGIDRHMADKPYELLGWHENNRIYCHLGSPEVKARYQGFAEWP